MNKRRISRAFLMSASALSGMTLSQAVAQDVEMAAADQLTQDTIIVTGTRRAVDIQDVPINITALSPETLQDEQIDDVRDLGLYTPGLTVADTGPRATGSIVLRGLSADDASTFGNNADDAVATYLGEVPLYLDFKLIDMERVEVLLGPQGTLYGLGTLAGAIRYIPERPDASEGFNGYVHGRAYALKESDDFSYIGDAAINVPIIEDKLAIRQTVGFYDEAGFIDYGLVLQEPGVSLPQTGVGFDLYATEEDRAANTRVAEDLNYEDTFTSRTQIGFFPTDSINTYLTYAYQETKSGGRQAVGDDIFGLGDYEAPWRYEEPQSRESELIALEAEIGVGSFAEIVTAVAYTEQVREAQNDVTDLLLDLDYGYELFPAFAGFTDIDEVREQVNAEIRLVSTHDGPLSWVLGAFYNEQKRDSTYFEILPGYPEYAGIFRPDEIEYASFVDATDTETAFFGELTYQITNDFQVTGGIRQYKYEAEVTGGQALPLFDTYPEINFSSRSGDTENDGNVWKLNSSYNFTDDIMVYGTVSTGYRIGGVNRVVPCVLPLPAGQNLCALPDELEYGPDETENMELGIRTTLFDGRLIANAAIYQIEWDGIQLSGQTVNGAIGITVNGGTATSEGIELSFQAQPTDNLKFFGNFSHAEATLTQDVAGLLQERTATGDVAEIDVLDGDRLPGSPEQSGALGATYTQPLSNGADLDFNWSMTYTGDILTRVGARASGEKLDSYTINNASIAYSTDDWTASFFVRNLFDEYAVTSVSNDLSRTFLNDGVASRYYAQSILRPRQIGVDLRFNF